MSKYQPFPVTPTIRFAAIIGFTLSIANLQSPCHGFAGSTTQQDATVGASSSATVRPPLPAADVNHLIGQLGSDDSQERDAAQQQLAKLGLDVVPALTKAAKDSVDPEVQSRAAAALSIIMEHAKYDSSPVTLHVKEVAVEDAITAIAGQVRGKITRVSLGMATGVVAKSVTVDADQKPFWEVISDVCRQTDLCPLLGNAGVGGFRLVPTPPNWILNAPHQVVGPYWIGVANIDHTRKIGLMGPNTFDDDFSISLIVYGEPKLTITRLSDFKLKEATDDAGNSLIPLPAPTGFKIIKAPSEIRRPPQILETSLKYPQHPGQRITVISGVVNLVLAESVTQFAIDDLSGLQKVTNPPSHCQIKATVTTGPKMDQVIVEATRDGMSDEEWSAINNSVNDIVLMDAQGRSLASSGFYPVISDDSFVQYEGFFTRNIFATDVHKGKPIARTSEPRRLTWNIAAKLKPVAIPVTFKDLPMPESANQQDNFVPASPPQAAG